MGRPVRNIYIDLTQPPRLRSYTTGCRTCEGCRFDTHWHAPGELWLAWYEPVPMWHIVERNGYGWVCLCSTKHVVKTYPVEAERIQHSCPHIIAAVKHIKLERAGIKEWAMSVKAPERLGVG